MQQILLRKILLIICWCYKYCSAPEESKVALAFPSTGKTSSSSSSSISLPSSSLQNPFFIIIVILSSSLNISRHQYFFTPPHQHCHIIKYYDDDDDDIQGGSHHGSYLEHWGPDLGGQGASFIVNFTTTSTNTTTTTTITTNTTTTTTTTNIIVNVIIIIIIIFNLYQVMGNLPKNNTWTNVAIRWEPLKFNDEATYSQALEDSGNDVSSLGGLQLFLNLERVAQSLLPVVSLSFPLRVLVPYCYFVLPSPCCPLWIFFHHCKSLLPVVSLCCLSESFFAC